MGRQLSGLLGVVAVAVLALALLAPAAVGAGGSETITGTIIAKTTPGVRTVVGSVVLARGVLSGSGKLVEIPGLPGDADNVLRDDLVFADGALHLVTTQESFDL